MIDPVAVYKTPNPLRRRRSAPLPRLLLLTCSALWTMSGSASCHPVPEADSFRVSQLGFSEKLENPCALRDSGSRLQAAVQPGDAGGRSQEILDELLAKTLLLRDNAATILRTNVLHDCSTLELPSVAIIPSTEELEDSSQVDALRLFYTSLLNHTAHVYFIAEQLRRHQADDDACRGASGGSQLAPGARALASHMRELMCILRMGALTASQSEEEEDDFAEPTSRILAEQLVDQPLCSRRSVRDCQTVASTATLLQALARYLQRTSGHVGAGDEATT